jgi:hypothetical protein
MTKLQQVSKIVIKMLNKHEIPPPSLPRLNQILKRQTSRSHYVSKVPAVTITVFKYRNKIGKTVVKAVPYSVK